MKITIHNLHKHFGKTKAVDDVSFTFDTGHIVGFVGPNGAGKTTTMRIIATLDEPTRGDVWIDNISVVQDPEKARQLVGYMPDSLPAHRDITVHEYLDFFARAYGITGLKRRRVVNDIEEFANLTGIREKMLRELSKGMKQRVSLARALVHDPPILILDEPAAGLDPRARIELRELLKVLAKRNKAILISSHILTELAEIISSSVFIERGRILRAGMLNDIMNEHENSAQTRVVFLRTLERMPDLPNLMVQCPGVERCEPADNGEVAIEIAGGDEQCAQLMAFLQQHDLRVVEFRQRRMRLEDIFLNITRGEVQ